MNKEQLKEKAAELGIPFHEDSTNDQLKYYIKMASDLQKAQDEKVKADEHALKLAEESTKRLSDLNQENVDLKTLNDELTTKLKKQSGVSNKVTVESNGKIYEFLVKQFRFKGVKYLAIDAAENPELYQELIELKATFLKEI